MKSPLGSRNKQTARSLERTSRAAMPYSRRSRRLQAITTSHVVYLTTITSSFPKGTHNKESSLQDVFLDLNTKKMLETRFGGQDYAAAIVWAFLLDKLVTSRFLAERNSENKLRITIII